MLSTAFIALLSFVLFGILSYEFVKWVSKKDENLVAERRAAGSLAAEVRNVGLDDFADFLSDYSVGDLPAMFEKIHNMATAVKLGGKDAILKNADSIFKTVLAAKLSTAEGRAWITALLAEATPPAPDATPAPQLPSLAPPNVSKAASAAK